MQPPPPDPSYLAPEARGRSRYRPPPDTTPAADAFVDDVVVEPFRGSVLVGDVDVVVVDDVVDVVPLVFFVPVPFSFGIVVVVVVVVGPVVAFSTS